MRRYIVLALMVPLVAGLAACSNDKEGTPGGGPGRVTAVQSGAHGRTTAPPKQRDYTGPAPADGLGAISGRVVWNEEPVAKAAVRLCEDVSTFSGCKGTKFDTTTGTDGGYVLTDITPGEYTLMVKAPDMSAYVFARTLSMDGDTLTVEADKGVDIGDFPLVRFDLKLTSPSDDARTKVAQPPLRWEAYPGAATYEVALMPEHGTSIFTSEEVDQPTITPKAPLLSCEYSWWVEAYNENGVQVGESEDHWRFRVEGQAASCYVDVISPADHAVVAAKGVTLKWTAHPLAKSYKLQAWRGNDSSNPLLDSLEVRATSYTIPETLQPGEYVYFVNAVNSDGDIIATNDSRYFVVR